jgi:hypothetical protein
MAVVGTVFGKLSLDRESEEISAFGNQRAVFATDDPVGVVRPPDLRTQVPRQRNGDSDQASEDLLANGYLYLSHVRASPTGRPFQDCRSRASGSIEGAFVLPRIGAAVSGGMQSLPWLVS